MHHRRSLVLGTALAACALAIVSHPFDGSITARAQSCEYRVSPVRVETGSAGLSGTITVDTQDGCAWTAAPVEAGIWGFTGTPSWLQLSTTAGIGSGTIAYTVSPLAPGNLYPIRQATIQVRWNTPTLGQNVLVTQITGPCTVNFQADFLAFGPKLTASRVTTFAEPPFTGPWYVASAPDWITFTQPPLGVLGRGDSQTSFIVSENPSTSPREGVIQTCSNSMRVYQAGRSLRDGPYVPADVDGDGIADLIVFRASSYGDGIPVQWFVLRSTSNYSYADARRYTASRSFAPPTPGTGDFDGDGKADFTVNGLVQLASAIDFRSAFGIPNWNPRNNDYPPTDEYSYLEADFVGDSRTDFISYRKGTGEWFVSAAGYGEPRLTLPPWGFPGDLPIPGDYDGDGRPDAAVWRPSNGTWYVLFSHGGYTYPISQAIQWGLPGDVPVSGDFDGDGRNDPAVWRPSDGRWYLRLSSTGFTTWRVHQWGVNGDVPVANDYDGDRITDLAVWRPSTGVWYLLFSTTGYSYPSYRAVQWGVGGDVPLK